MSKLPENVEIGQMKCWPLAGFAPGSYTCKCKDCEKHFWGDKRARQCLECAVNATKAHVGNVQNAMVKLQKSSEQETIVAAAVFHGCAISLPPPARHHTILNFMATVLGLDAVLAGQPANQGFLTSKGRFVNRAEGFYLAHAAGQIIHKSGNTSEPTLYSEDMW